MGSEGSMAADGTVSSNYNDGLQSKDGVPIIAIMVASINTLMYMSIPAMVFLKLVRLEIWQKITAAGLTVPEYVGYAIWLTHDTKATRKIYLICQYFSFFSLLSATIYHFFATLFDYFVAEDGVDQTEVSITGSALLGFGVFGTFFLMIFQDYNAE
mmetsp:Transcript_23838/g.31923  ORF Transcript_23838/g.31923 Transcript_23838/m.31923 type:complete len:156 (+) Transcript_23838:141-608(+)